jgi:uncharacterized Zn-finger protein
MSDDVECPYCEKFVEINHDDGYGYEENETHNQECGYCGNVFAYTTSISFSYESEKAPCLNGGGHKTKPVLGDPREYFVGVTRCEYCGEEFVDQNARDKAISEYMEKKKGGKSEL